MVDEEAVLRACETRREGGLEIMGEGGAGRVGTRLDTDVCLLIRRRGEFVEEGVMAEEDDDLNVCEFILFIGGIVTDGLDALSGEV